LLAPLAAQMQTELAANPADEAAVLHRYGKLYLQQMLARAPVGTSPKFVVDKMLVRWLWIVGLLLLGCG